MTELFQTNLAIIQQRWPLAAAMLKHQDIQTLDAMLVNGLNQTISIQGIQLSSRHQRLAETQLLLSTLPADARSVTVYGTGMGDVATELLSQRKLERLQVCVLNPTIFALVLHYTDQTAWLRHPATLLTLQPAQDRIEKPYIALTPELVLSHDDNARLRDLLVLDLNLPFINRRHQQQDPAIQQRFSSNMANLKADQDIVALRPYFKGYQAIVIASGPSLEEHYPYLQRLMRNPHRPLIISVDTALRGLLHHGITPDIVISIDGAISEYHLPLEMTEQITLVYFPRLNPSVISQWRGPRYNAYGNSPLYDELAKQLPKSRLFTNGSVLHPALDLAVFLGFKEITLLGCDFCYYGAKSHAFWRQYATITQDKLAERWVNNLDKLVQHANHWIFNGRGEKVPTSLNLQAYLRNLEWYIGKHPQIKFYQSSLSGAKISGTQYKELL